MEDKGNIEKRQRASDKAKKKGNVNDEVYSGGGEDDAVTPSSSKRGRGRNSGSDSDKVGSKRYRTISKSRRGESSSDSENVLKRNSGGRILQVQGQG